MDWEQRVDDLWSSLDDHDEEEFLAKMEQLASELPADSPEAAFALLRAERESSSDELGDQPS